MPAWTPAHPDWGASRARGVSPARLGRRGRLPPRSPAPVASRRAGETSTPPKAGPGCAGVPARTFPQGAAPAGKHGRRPRSPAPVALRTPAHPSPAFGGVALPSGGRAAGADFPGARASRPHVCGRGERGAITIAAAPRGPDNGSGTVNTRRSVDAGGRGTASLPPAGGNRQAISACAVHPRVCGGSVWRRGRRAGRNGASPRVRGKRGYRPAAVERIGCIPACAGEAPPTGRRSSRPGVHPRVCGGSVYRVVSTGYERSASPRVRGKRDDGPGQLAEHDCIPACAGEAAPRACRPPPDRVHPRVCGGSVTPGMKWPWRWGASPRVRGKLGEFRSAFAPGRCIPACAGEAFLRWVVIGGSAVHPRVCGGSRSHASVQGRWSGASPRVRGKRGAPTR